MTGTARHAVTLADVAAAHRERWVEARCGERAVVRLDSRPDPLETLRGALAGEPAGVIAWLDGVPKAGPDRALLDELVAAARRGWGIAVAVPGAGTELPPDPVAAAEQPAAVAAALAQALGDAEVVPQRLAEASIIATAAGPLAGELQDAETDVADVHAWLVLAGLDVAGSSALALSAGTLHRTYLLWLEASNAELNRANVRLARDRIGSYDTAAASLVNRVTLAQDAQRRAEDERDAAIERLELEKQVAARNHGYFEDARAKLAEPHHRIAEGFVRRARRVPGAKLLGGTIARRTLPRG